MTLFAQVPLEQFARGIQVHHVTGGKDVAYNCVRIRWVDTDEFSLVFEATDGNIAAQRFVVHEYVADGGAGVKAVTLPADVAKRMFDAVKSQVQNDRGKYDPTGYDVRIRLVEDRDPDTSSLSAVEIALYDTFHDQRLEMRSSQWEGQYPDVDAVFDKASDVHHLGRFRMNLRLLQKVVKSTGERNPVPAIRFVSDRGAMRFSIPGQETWRALMGPSVSSGADLSDDEEE